MDGINAVSCTGAFGSPIFSIYAGPSQTRLYVHASIVAKSPVLRKIVEGDWEDSHERVIFLEDHDTATVECMLQWLYCGYYTWCDTITPAASPNPGITSDGNRNYVTSLAADGGRLIWLSPRTFLEGRELVAHPSDSEPTTASNPRKILGLVLPDQSRKMYRELSNHHEASLIEEAVRVCTPNGTTLLRDAKLYALAQYLELPRLKSLTLQNIQDVLYDIASKPQKANSELPSNVIKFVRYAYECTDSLNNSVEPLRGAVSAFVALYYQAVKSTEFGTLIWEGGDLAVDVVKMMTEMIGH